MFRIFHDLLLIQTSEMCKARGKWFIVILLYTIVINWPQKCCLLQLLLEQCIQPWERFCSMWLLSSVMCIRISSPAHRFIKTSNCNLICKVLEATETRVGSEKRVRSIRPTSFFRGKRAQCQHSESDDDLPAAHFRLKKFHNQKENIFICSSTRSRAL